MVKMPIFCIDFTKKCRKTIAFYANTCYNSNSFGPMGQKPHLNKLELS